MEKMPVVQKKVCLLGDFAVGKTSLVRRYVEGKFDDKYLSTIGVKISRKVLDRGGYTLNLLIWDLAGGEDFEEVSQRYLLGAVGALIVCDLTRAETLTYMEGYAEQLRASDASAAIVLAGNKVDLAEELVIGRDTLETLGRATGSPWLLTSAKTGEHVEETFRLLAEQIEASA